MLAVYASALAIILASLVLGRGLLRLLGRQEGSGLDGAVGFAALTVACPLLIRLPGRATTLAILVGIALVVSLAYLRHETGSLIGGRLGGETRAATAIPVAAVVVALGGASLPFLFNDRVGPLGEGIYTNDQAAQLYWTDWLQNGTGPEPGAVQLGYPTGPQAVTAAAAEASGAALDDAFNGLLVAIPALTALVALAALGELPPVRRVIVASLTALPFLAASFLAQSAFKETAMALLLLAFAIALGQLAPGGRGEPARGVPRRATALTLALLAAASIFVYSLPGLAWFVVALPIWAALEMVAGRLRVDFEAIGGVLRRHRAAIAVVALVVVAVAAFSATQLSHFLGRVGDVQASAGRLSSPVYPGEVLGVWPEEDFRIVRSEVEGAYPAVALGLLVAALGGLVALRRRDYALVAALAAAAAVYAWARPFAGIHVEAKALAVAAPLVAFAGLRALLAPREGEPDARLRARYALGGVFAAALAASTFLALRAAPVGFDERGRELESLAGLIPGRSVAFLGVDRFAGYWLRGTLAESPGGYVPADIRARPEKVWQQGRAMDFDTLSPRRLDEFDYAITTAAAYASTPPPNFELVNSTSSFALWKRTGPTPDLRVLDEDGAPGRTLDCGKAHSGELASRGGTATVLDDPVIGKPGGWSRSSPFDAPDSATQRLELDPGRWELSLQYHSQSPLTVSAPGLKAELPPSLDGMYLLHQGQGSFWPVGAVKAPKGEALTITLSAGGRTGLQRALGVKRQVWLGEIAATRAGSAQEMPLADACGRYVDHFLLGHGAASH